MPDHRGSNAPPASRYFEIATIAFPPGQQREFWRYGILNRSEADFHPTDLARSYHGQLRGYLGTHSQIRDGQADPIILRRTAALCRRDGSDEILLSAILHLGRPARVNHDGREVEIHQGDIMMYDFARPLEIDVGRYREVNFRLSRSLVAAATGRDPAAFGGTALPRTPLTRMLFAHLRDFVEALPVMTDTERQATLDVATEFALQALSVAGGGLPPEDDTRADWLWEAVKRLIDRNLAHQDLSPERLAHALSNSRSSIYRLFRGRGLTVMGYVMERRLARARDMLGDPENRLTIADISAACGFDDPSYFSQVFRRRFGCQPREARERGWHGGTGTASGEPDTPGR